MGKRMAASRTTTVSRTFCGLRSSLNSLVISPSPWLQRLLPSEPLICSG